MTDLTKNTVQQLARLCRLHMEDDEADEVYVQMEKILSYVDQMHEVDTKDVPPCNQVIDTTSSVTRPDEVGKTLDRDDLLENSPEHVDGMIKVPPVIRGHQS